MPRDNMPDQPVSPMASCLERLIRLRELAAKTQGDQNHFGSCLYWEMRHDKLLQNAGLELTQYNPSLWEEKHIAKFFDIDGNSVNTLISGLSIEYKRRRIEALINAARGGREPLPAAALEAHAQR